MLDHPKDVVNSAGVMRVMMNLGLSHLRLVRPDEFDAYRIEGIAHRSTPLIESATVHDTLADALADTSFVVGTSAIDAVRNAVLPVTPRIREDIRKFCAWASRTIRRIVGMSPGSMRRPSA